MHAHTNRAGRFVARLGLESLEGRTLPSATLPAPAPVTGPAVVHQSNAIQVQHLATAQSSHQGHSTVQAAYANYLFHWGVGPSAVIVGTNTTTGNGKSTGSVDFALIRDAGDSSRLGGAATAVPLGFVVTTSSADSANPDRFTNTPVTLQLSLRDSSSGVTGKFTFQGTIKGTLTMAKSTLTISFPAKSATQKLTLGNHVYTVTLPTSMTPTGPTDVPTPVYAFVQVSNAAVMSSRH